MNAESLQRAIIHCFILNILKAPSLYKNPQNKLFNKNKSLYVVHEDKNAGKWQPDCLHTTKGKTTDELKHYFTRQQE